MWGVVDEIENLLMLFGCINMILRWWESGLILAFIINMILIKVSCGDNTWTLLIQLWFCK
jgi:hypothetical protein